MPTYEMPILLRTMTKPETVSTLKRVTTRIFQRGGFIRKIESLGHRPTPCKANAHGQVFREASYFLLHFDAPPRKMEDLLEECGRDIDIIRTRAYSKKSENNPVQPCTWHDEMLPTAYRPEVQKLVAIAEKSKRGFTKEFKFNTGLDYYPFQR